MAAYKLAIVLLAAALAPPSHAQGYGGVPSGVKGHRTTTTFAPDVIPSDQQAINFNQQNPNPAPAYNQPGPSYNQPGPGANQPGPAHNQGGPAHNQGGPAHNQPGPAHNQGGPAHNQGGPAHNQGGPAHNQGGPSYNQPGPSYNQPGQGPLKDNNINGFAGESPNQGAPSGGDFWWMNPDNPFKGAAPEPQPQPGTPGHQQASPGSPSCGQGQNCGQPNKPNSQYPSGNQPNKPNSPYPSGNQPTGSQPGQGCQHGQNCGGGSHINPNNPFINPGTKPSGTPSYPSGSPSYPSGNPSYPSGQNQQGCQSGQNCGQQQPGKPNSPYPNQKPTPIHSGINPNNPFIGAGQNQVGQGSNQYPGTNQGPYPGASQGVSCTGSGYLCVSKYNCQNGVVVDNGGLQAKSGPQHCDAASQVCCRLASPPPSGGGAYPPGGPIKNTNNYPTYQGKGSAPGTNGIPIGGSIYDGPTANPNIQPYTGPLNVTPYPGCAAALKCVELIYCTAEGVMSDEPVALTREQDENRVPLSECSNPETGILGKCCRDPNYKDPWPGGMMMPGGAGGHQHGPTDQSGFPTGQYVDHAANPNQQHQFNQQGSVSNGPLITHNAPQGSPQNTPTNYQPGGVKPLPQRPPTSPEIYQQPQQPNYNQQPNIPQQRPNIPQQKPTFPQQQQNFPTQQQQKPNFPQQQPNFPTQQQQKPNFPQQQPNFPTQQQQKPNFPQQQPNFPTQQQQKPNFPQQQPNFPKPVAPVQQPFPSQEPAQYQPQPGVVNFAQQRPEQPVYPKSPEKAVPAGPRPGTECGLKRNVDRSGLSDVDCGFGEYPWHVVVMSASTRQPLCSGALISDRAVATAAHCVKDMDSSDILIEAGIWKLGSTSAPHASQSSPVAAIARHPEFEEVSLSNDMAVLLLSGPLQLDQHIDTICLPEGQSRPQGSCVATGFGKQALQGNVPGSILHQIAVNIIPNDVCEDKFKLTNLGKYFELKSSFQCAVPTVPAHDLCKVDAGGPIACDRGDGHHELTALYSWDVGCNPQAANPTALASVDTAWIQSVLNRPIDVILREELNEVEKRKKAQEVLDVETKPGFSQGYGKK